MGIILSFCTNLTLISKLILIYMVKLVLIYIIACLLLGVVEGTIAAIMLFVYFKKYEKFSNLTLQVLILLRKELCELEKTAPVQFISDHDKIDQFADDISELVPRAHSVRQVKFDGQIRMYREYFARMKETESELCEYASDVVYRLAIENQEINSYIEEMKLHTKGKRK